MVTTAGPVVEAGEKLISKPVPRRSILRLFLGGSVTAFAASLLSPLVRYLVPPVEATSAASDALAGLVGELKPNSAKTFGFGAKPALLVRLASGEYRSMSAVCTHLGCTVQYRPETQQIWCPCHNGCYDVNGRNVSGPPPHPLLTYDVNIRGQEIYACRKQDA
jgi:Rieske Fe-S protein